MNTTRNPFSDRIALASREGYLGGPRKFRPTPGAPVSEAQSTLIQSLLAERDLSAEARPKYAARLRALAADWNGAKAGMTRTQASALIECLMALPTAQAADAQAVPAGRYAVQIEDRLVFFKVDAPTEGRWAGYTFVEQQLSDEFVRVHRAFQRKLLEQLRRDGFAKASMVYGRELGVCGVCSRTLTNEESRAAGIGPVCREKNGW